MTAGGIGRTAHRAGTLRRLMALVTVLLTLCCAVCVKARETDATETVSFAEGSTYGGSVKNAGKILTDGKVKNYCTYPAGGKLTVTLPEEAEAEWLYLEWFSLPAAFSYTCCDETETALADGTVSGADVRWNDCIDLPEGTRSVMIALPEGGEISSCIPGAGAQPGDWHPWEPEAEKTDYLIVSMHPDDDVLFMGAVTPILADAGYTGSILYLSASERARVTEALNGAWTMGQRHYPLFGDLPDYPSIDKYKIKYKDSFTPDFVAQTIVRAIRRVRPEVLITHSITGEYGHWQHIITSEAALIAVQKAADPSYDPESVEFYGTWQVKKLYRHLDEENVLTLDVETPIASFDGKTAWEVAREAYLCHRTQQAGRHQCSNEGVYDLTRFSLTWSAVGEDLSHGGFFENIDEREFTGYVEPEPAPEPTPEPTPEPAPAPTPAPAPVETLAPEPLPTASTADGNAGQTTSARVLIAAGIGMAALLALILTLAGKDRKKLRR